VAKYYIESGDVKQIIVDNDALNAAKKFMQWVIKMDNVCNLSPGIMVCERGFYKDFMAGKYSSEYSKKESEERVKKRIIIREMYEYIGKGIDEAVMFMTELVMKEIGHIT
jgi:AAA15 family ATPase/GTPase